jgi:hypothetical protein
VLKTDLATTLAYQNADVTARFAEDFHVSPADAEEIFTECKRWLWISAKRKVELERGIGESFIVPLFNEAFAIDLMWHTFLLFTEDYSEFCERHFGFFVHHYPRPRAERLAWAEKIRTDPEGARAERTASLEKVYSYLYDELGPEILVKWCEEFPARFAFRPKN